MAIASILVVTYFIATSQLSISVAAKGLVSFLQGVKRILLITDPYHMLRSLLTFRHLGFKVIPHFSPIPPDLSPKDKALMVFYEYLALVSYGLKGRFFSI